MRIATWNVNSLRARLGHVTRWLATHHPDVLALQETKVRDEDFPHAVFAELGWEVVATGQPSYNGVALLARTPLQDVLTSLPGAPDEQRRFLSARIAGLRVVNVYVPNGAEVDSDKYRYKLAWLGALRDHLAVLRQAAQPVVVLGDFNVAPEDRDVHDPDLWRGRILCSDAERSALGEVLALGFGDALRLLEPAAGLHSWWDYRANAFRRNHGLRIDLILTDARLASDVTGVYIDREPRGWPQPSDHAPVVLGLETAFRDGSQ